MRRRPSLHQSTMLIDHLGLGRRLRCCNKLRADYHNSKLKKTWQQRKLMIFEDEKLAFTDILRFLNRSENEKQLRVATDWRSKCSEWFVVEINRFSVNKLNNVRESSFSGRNGFKFDLRPNRNWTSRGDQPWYLQIAVWTLNEIANQMADWIMAILM